MYLPTLVSVLGVSEVGKTITGTSREFRNSRASVQGSGSCRSVREHHRLPGTFGGVGGKWAQEEWAVGAVVLTLAVLVQTRVNSTDRSGAQMCVRQISLPPWSLRSRAEKYLTEPANELAVPGVQPPGRATCPLSTGSGTEKSLLSFSFKLCSLSTFAFILLLLYINGNYV